MGVVKRRRLARRRAISTRKFGIFLAPRRRKRNGELNSIDIEAGFKGLLSDDVSRARLEGRSSRMPFQIRHPVQAFHASSFLGDGGSVGAIVWAVWRFFFQCIV